MKKNKKTSMKWVKGVLVIFFASWLACEIELNPTTLTFFVCSGIITGIVLALEVQRVANEDDEQYRGKE